MMREVVYYQSPVGDLEIGTENNVLMSIEFTEKTTLNRATLSETAKQTILQLQDKKSGKN